MKISVYLGNNIGCKVDARNVLNGNPGVGGAHYCLLLLATLLSRDSRYDVNVITVRDYLLSDGIAVTKVKGDNEVVQACEQSHTDILILKHFTNSILEEDIRKSNLKVIVWSHNFISNTFCRYITKTPQIKKNVFVGKQQYDNYIDDDVINKSTYIYNIVTTSASQKRANDSKTVVFVGAICRKKGFLEMCKIWPGIVRDVPDAKLLVCGNGKLYGDAQLGPYGIADEKYERQFTPYITDVNGEILPSIEFLGVVGEEKKEIFRRASVGVVNPSGARETFGMVIIEMGLAGLPVATISTPGYYDTLRDKESGYLAKSLPELQYKIIKLLKVRRLNEEMGGGAMKIASEFSPQNILPQWHELLNEVFNDKVQTRVYPPSKPYSINFKWLRIIIRYLRFNLKLSFLPSSIKLEEKAKSIISK